MVATIVVASISLKRSITWQPLAALAFGASLVALGATNTFPIGLLAMIFVGGLAAAFQSLNNSLVMSMTDPEYHGRVQSMNMLSWSLFGLAALPIGVLADHIGIRETLAIQGVVCIAAIIAIEGLRRFSQGGIEHRPAPEALPLPADAPVGGAR